MLYNMSISFWFHYFSLLARLVKSLVGWSNIGRAKKIVIANANNRYAISANGAEPKKFVKVGKTPMPQSQ